MQEAKLSWKVQMQMIWLFQEYQWIYVSGFMQREMYIIYVNVFTVILLKNSDVLEKSSVLICPLLIPSFCCLGNWKLREVFRQTYVVLAQISLVGTRGQKITKITFLPENVSACLTSVWPLNKVRQYTTLNKESLHSCSFWKVSMWKRWIQFCFLGWIPPETCFTWEQALMLILLKKKNLRYSVFTIHQN